MGSSAGADEKEKFDSGEDCGFYNGRFFGESG